MTIQPNYIALWSTASARFNRISLSRSIEIEPVAPCFRPQIQHRRKVQIDTEPGQLASMDPAEFFGFRPSLVRREVRERGKRRQSCQRRREVRDDAAFLRRMTPRATDGANGTAPSKGHLSVDPEQHVAAFAGTPLRLTAIEFGIVRMTVSNDGDPISDANREKIFDAFFTTRRDTGGTGMGLAIVQAVMVSHGGSIRRGVAFELLFPAV
jgi:hypothetical protein